MIIIRKMMPEEAVTVRKIAWRAFGIIERLFISKPKEVMVAEVDGKIAGGIIIKYIMTRGRKIGYFDGAFIDPSYQGQGIGRKLYRETTNYLWKQGCDALTALVKDDNAASWKLFLENDFSRVTIGEGCRQLGIVPMLKQYFTTPFWLANGMEFYLVVKEQTAEDKKVRTSQQIGLFLLANILLILPAALWNQSHAMLFMAAYMVLLTGSILGGGIGTFLSKKQWRFRLNSGGAALSFLINLMGLYPVVGNWYPDEYDNTYECRKAMGMSALGEWLVILVLTIGGVVFQEGSIFYNYLAQLGSTLLFYHILIFYPFETYGGRRVYLWNKGGYGILTLLSIYVIAIS